MEFKTKKEAEAYLKGLIAMKKHHEVMRKLLDNTIETIIEQSKKNLKEAKQDDKKRTNRPKINQK